MSTVPQTDVFQLVNSLAATKKGAAKDSKPAIFDDSLAPVIETYITRKSEAETATALMEAAKEQIVSFVRPKRLEACAAAGKVIASLSVNNRLTFTQTCRYSNVLQERGDALREAFGESFARYFADTLSISLKRESANDESVLTKLVESLGGEFFAANFDVRRDLIVKDAFHNDYSCRPEVTELAQPFLDEQTIRPYAPSLKVK
jgi:hypothetical protein